VVVSLVISLWVKEDTHLISISKGNFIYDKDKEDLFSGDPIILVGRPKEDGSL
jgi:hypothetical protein